MVAQIRRAITDDAAVLSMLNATVQQIHADALPHVFKQPSEATFPPATVVELMANPNHRFLLAEAEDTIVGYIWAEIRCRRKMPYNSPAIPFWSTIFPSNLHVAIVGTASGC